MQKQRKTYDALFRGKSFIDCALAVRKLKDFHDFLPEIMRGLGVTPRDIETGPIKVDKSIVDAFLNAIPDKIDDPVYGPIPDMVSNAIHGKLCDIALAAFFKGQESTVYRAFSLATADQRNELWNRGVMVPVSEWTRQISFLWNSFKLNTPSIDVLTKDAFDLVKATKLDSNVTREMVEMAFPQDVFLTIQSSFMGFKEVAILRRGDKISVVCGQLLDKKETNVLVANPCPFAVMGTIDLVKHVGNVTRKNLSSSIIEEHQKNTDELDRRLADMGLTREAVDKVHDIFDKTFVNKEEQGEAAGTISEIAMFVLKLRLMMTAEKTPIEMERSVVGQSVCRKGVQLPPGKEDGLSFSVISLTKEFEEAQRQHRATGEKLDKFGKKIVEKQIGAFLRKQHYGPKNGLTKFIWIAPFTNRFWCNTGIHITKIIK